jgi:hypothetical protein
MKEKLAPTEQIPNEVRILTNVAFLMADVTDTFLLDAYSRVKSLGMDFKREEKQKWKRAVEQTRLARRSWQEVSQQMYNVPNVEIACEDSDFFADVLLLMVDRVGDKDERQQMVRNFLKRMKSEIHIYEKLSHNKL